MTPRPGSTQQASDRAGPSRVGLGSRRVVWGAFAASVAIHLFAIFLYPYVFGDLNPETPSALPPDPEPPQGVELIELVEDEPTAEPTTPEEPERIAEVEQPAAEVEAPELDDPTGIEVVPYTGVAERLRPALSDERLWRDLPPEFYELTLEQREEVVIARRLAAWYDSVQAGMLAEEALTDWTFTDSEGGRWGISPGKLHLGSITLPLPVNFGVPVGKRDETNTLVWQWEEIMRQSQRAQIQATWQERAAAIRARRDRERSAVVVPPDTTGGRR